LSYKKIIQQISAAFLLVLFTFSITPKRFIHDVLAQHTDSKVICNNDISEKHFHESGIKCECDQLVVESPFLQTIVAFHSNITHCYFITSQLFVQHYFSIHHTLVSLRGPPPQA
jgi:hypothetical protein